MCKSVKNQKLKTNTNSTLSSCKHRRRKKSDDIRTSFGFIIKCVKRKSVEIKVISKFSVFFSKRHFRLSMYDILKTK